MFTHRSSTATGTAGIAGAAIAALLVFAPSAAALDTVAVNGVDQGGGVFVGTATCPPGKTVVSGGYEGPDETVAVVNKAKGDRSWFVHALTATSLTVTANCSKRLDPSLSSATRTFAGDEVVNMTAKARCERGQAVAGGWRFEPPAGSAQDTDSTVFTSNRKRRDRWAVTAFAQEPNSKIKAFAYCLRGLDVRARSEDSAEIPDEQSGSVTAKCRRGEELLGGGFKTSPRPDWNNIAGPDHFYSASHRSGPRAWLAAAHNYSSVAGVITTTAICRT